MKTILIHSASLVLFIQGVSRAETLHVDTERSRIQVDAKATGHAFTGDLTKYSAKVEGDRASAQPEKLELNWDFTDLKTGDEKRDAEMIKWLGGGKAKGSFVFEKSWDETTEGGSAQGALTINGVSKTYGFTYKVKKEGDWVTVDGQVAMDYQNFKLPLIRSMAIMTVDPKLSVRFHLVGKLK